MGLTGSFRGLSITEMLQLIRMAKKTGALRIRLNDGVQQTLFVRSGQVIGVESGKESLGPILLEQGTVAEASLNEAIEAQKTTARDQPIEQILLDSGHIGQEAIIQALMSQAERTVGALIQERGGQVSFQEGAQPELNLEIALDLQSILMAASVQADHDQNRQEDDNPESIYQRSVAASEAFRTKKMELWLGDWKVFLAIDAMRSISDICSKTKMAQEAVQESISKLLDRGYVEHVEAEDKRPTVLIVDDSLTIQKMVEMALEKENLHLVTASTGEAAQTALDEEEPDLILLDVMLPDTNGYRLCQQIRSMSGRYSEIPIIMLTARDSPQDENLGKHAGASAYMTKPFSPDVLRQNVRKALNA
jgi:twitching motility two-component system response regulator PilG